MPQHRGGKKGKRPDNRPARARYAGKFPGPLKARKLRNLVRCSGMTPEKVLKLWEGSRWHLRLEPKKREKVSPVDLVFSSLRG